MTVILYDKQLPYTLNSIISCEPPSNADGDNWFQYKITQGANIITGYKCGEFNQVKESIENNIERLNQRQKGKFGSLNNSTTTKP